MWRFPAVSDLLVAVADSPFPSLDPVERALRPLSARLCMSTSPAAEDILAAARETDALLVCYAKLPGDLIRELTRCKVIGRTGLGVDNIGLAAARERGIVVTYVPDYCMAEVSDHAMALQLALARKVPFANAMVQSSLIALRRPSSGAPRHLLPEGEGMCAQ
jgi:D-3-phosphoglycerate dehydrogenase / 2-oxoglutarate reductase